MESVKKIMDRLKKAVHDKKERNMNKRNAYDERENNAVKTGSLWHYGITVRTIAITVAVMCVAFIILYIKINIDNRDKLSDVVTESFISGQLNELNELAVSKVIYDGVVKMEDKSGFFNKEFYIKYTGYVKSYVDMSKAEIKIDDKKRKISVSLPHAVVGEPNIGADYQIYDTSWIKSDSLEAATKALKRAEEDCRKKVDEKTMIETSDGYAKEAVENFLSSFKDVTKPYTFEVKFI